MQLTKKNLRLGLVMALATATIILGGCGTLDKMGIRMPGTAAELTGAQEVPPVSTRATGKSTIRVSDDRTVSGTVTVDGMTPTAAHIHQGAAGTNGPVIIPLAKSGEKSFSVPPNTKLTDAQFAAFKAGQLYINVHSAAYPGGELRVQMKP